MNKQNGLAFTVVLCLSMIAIALGATNAIGQTIKPQNPAHIRKDGAIETHIVPEKTDPYFLFASQLPQVTPPAEQKSELVPVNGFKCPEKKPEGKKIWGIRFVKNTPTTQTGCTPGDGSGRIPEGFSSLSWSSESFLLRNHMAINQMIATGNLKAPTKGAGGFFKEVLKSQLPKLPKKP